MFCDALRDFNVEVQYCPGFELAFEEAIPVWEYIDHPMQESSEQQSYVAQLLAPDPITLDFEVRYQLEVCISEGYLNEYSLTYTFVERLVQMDKNRARQLLEQVTIQKKRVFDPMEIFQRPVALASAQRKIPNYCIRIRSATVTPTTIYYATPTIEISNRVIRHFSEHADRFLRVRFIEERPKVCDFPVDPRPPTNGIPFAGENFFDAQGNDE